MCLGWGFVVVQLLRHIQLFVTQWTAARQASLSFTISWSLFKLMSIESVMPSNNLLLSSPSPALNPFQHQDFFQWVSSLLQVAQVLELHLQRWSFQWIFKTDFIKDRLVWSPCSSRDSQESSPTPQFKSIDSSVLILLYGPTLTSIHDYWKNHSFDYLDLCWQSNVSAF